MNVKRLIPTIVFCLIGLTLFTNAHCKTQNCGPSRARIMTGFDISTLHLISNGNQTVKLTNEVAVFSNKAWREHSAIDVSKQNYWYLVFLYEYSAQWNRAKVDNASNVTDHFL